MKTKVEEERMRLEKLRSERPFRSGVSKEAERQDAARSYAESGPHYPAYIRRELRKRGRYLGR